MKSRLEPMVVHVGQGLGSTFRVGTTVGGQLPSPALIPPPPPYPPPLGEREDVCFQATDNISHQH